MKRTASVALSALFCLVLAQPLFAQNENNQWTAIQDERDARRKAEKIEAFIRSFPNSSYRPDVDKTLITFYVDNKDNAKIMQHAESFRLTLPTADNASKTFVFSQAMIAAASINNVPKTVEYGNYALTADPNNITVLVFLSANNLPDPAKALEYAQRVVIAPKPATMAEAQFATMQARMHGLIGNALFSQQKLKEAGEHFQAVLKVNPKDHAIQFRSGFISMNLMGDAAQGAQAANDELIKAMTATPTNQENVAKARAKVEEQSKVALDHRDAAMDSFAKAVAVGGQFGAQAKQLLDSLYQNKNKSLDGEDLLIAEKKKELGLP